MLELESAHTREERRGAPESAAAQTHAKPWQSNGDYHQSPPTNQGSQKRRLHPTSPTHARLHRPAAALEPSGAATLPAAAAGALGLSGSSGRGPPPHAPLLMESRHDAAGVVGGGLMTNGSLSQLQQQQRPLGPAPRLGLQPSPAPVRTSQIPRRTMASMLDSSDEEEGNTAPALPPPTVPSASATAIGLGLPRAISVPADPAVTPNPQRIIPPPEPRHQNGPIHKSRDAVPNVVDNSGLPRRADSAPVGTESCKSADPPAGLPRRSSTTSILRRNSSTNGAAASNSHTVGSRDGNVASLSRPCSPASTLLSHALTSLSLSGSSPQLWQILWCTCSGSLMLLLRQQSVLRLPVAASVSGAASGLISSPHATVTAASVPRDCNHSSSTKGTKRAAAAASAALSQLSADLHALAVSGTDGTAVMRALLAYLTQMATSVDLSATADATADATAAATITVAVSSTSGVHNHPHRDSSSSALLLHHAPSLTAALHVLSQLLCHCAPCAATITHGMYRSQAVAAAAAAQSVPSIVISATTDPSSAAGTGMGLALGHAQVQQPVRHLHRHTALLQSYRNTLRHKGTPGQASVNPEPETAQEQTAMDISPSNAKPAAAAAKAAATALGSSAVNTHHGVSVENGDAGSSMLIVSLLLRLGDAYAAVPVVEEASGDVHGWWSRTVDHASAAALHSLALLLPADSTREVSLF